MGNLNYIYWYKDFIIKPYFQKNKEFKNKC